jgi:hypothetical protein
MFQDRMRMKQVLKKVDAEAKRGREGAGDKSQTRRVTSASVHACTRSNSRSALAAAAISFSGAVSSYHRHTCSQKGTGSAHANTIISL